MKIKSYEDLNDVLLELGRIQTILQKAEADMNNEIQVIKDKYSELTAEDSGKAALIGDCIEKFLAEHKSEFTTKRSMLLMHGKVGFRTNPPKVVQLNKKWRVESSIAFLRKLFKGLYLREKPEIDKDSILADYAKGTLTDEQLAGVGLRVDQDENPLYESNWVELQSAGKSAA